MLRQFSSQGVHIAFIDVAPEGHDRGEPVLLIHGFASTHRINWVNPRWVETLTRAGRRVVAFDNRGHGASEKLYAPAEYHGKLMAGDAGNLLSFLKIERADVMGYSMGARIASFLALAKPELVRSLILGGLGDRLVRSAGLPEGIAEAMDGPRSTGSPTRRSGCFAPLPTRRRATAPRSPRASGGRARALRRPRSGGSPRRR